MERDGDENNSKTHVFGTKERMNMSEERKKEREREREREREYVCVFLLSHLLLATHDVAHVTDVFQQLLKDGKGREK